MESYLKYSRAKNIFKGIFLNRDELYTVAKIPIDIITLYLLWENWVKRRI